jgi:O-antigen/teichoic acid export membrane protein
MTALARILVGVSGVPAENRALAAANLVAAFTRYALSAFGPIAISAAHFIAALILLHALPRAAFGLFSFLMVVSPFAWSLCGAFFAPPIARSIAKPEGPGAAETLTYFKANTVFALLAAVALGLTLFASGADGRLALIFGVYGGIMSLRWFARCWAYGATQTVRVLSSDLAYSGIVIAGLLATLATHMLTIVAAGLVLLVAAGASLAMFRATYFRPQWVALRKGELKPFARVWRELSGWAVLGVISSEATVNAHAYLVTFLSGPHAFAVLAIGTLLMRPVSLVLSALPDMERPLMSRALGAGQRGRAFRIVKEFRTAAGAIWVATILAAAALLTWFPRLILKHDYPFTDVAAVVAISAAIMAVRSFRTPESVLLQAAGEFKRLAGAGLWASSVSLATTFVLLLIAGPVAALVGILIGEMVATQRTFAIARNWKAAHG